jgi:hypothetical protein
MNTHKFSPLASKMLCIPQVTALDGAVEKAQVRTFNKGIEKALLLLEGNKWLKDSEGITYLKDSNLTQEKACIDAYGLQKQTYSLYVRNAKAVERIPNVVENFLAKCDAKEGAASYSMQSFEKFWKALDKAVANPLGLDEEGEGEDTTEGSVVDKVDVSTKPIITLAFNGEAIGKTNVSLRITDKGEMKTTSSVEDIQSVIAYLQKAVKQMKADKPKAVEPKVTKKAKDDKANEVKRATLPMPKAEDKPKAASKFKVKPSVDVKAQALADFEASLEPTELVEEDFFFINLPS